MSTHPSSFLFLFLFFFKFLPFLSFSERSALIFPFPGQVFSYGKASGHKKAACFFTRPNPGVFPRRMPPEGPFYGFPRYSSFVREKQRSSRALPSQIFHARRSVPS